MMVACFVSQHDIVSRESTSETPWQQVLEARKCPGRAASRVVHGHRFLAPVTLATLFREQVGAHLVTALLGVLGCGRLDPEVHHWCTETGPHDVLDLTIEDSLVDFRGPLQWRLDQQKLGHPYRGLIFRLRKQATV